jgi:hypothetical protein
LQEKITTFFGVTSQKDIEFLKWMGWEPGMIQLVFEFFCGEFKAAPLFFNKFMQEKENGWMKLTFKNYHLNEPTLKAIACILPWLV